MRSERVAAAIVAGGSSSRFGGRPKGLETIGGQRIVDRVIDAAKAVSTELLVISNSDDAPQWFHGLPVVRDLRPERGSLIGIHTALAVANRPSLVIAWDMPFVTTALLSAIVGRAEEEAFAVIPESPSGLEPFCALYTPACLPLIERAIAEHDLRATALPMRFPSFTKIPVSEIERIGDPRQLFFNVNSAEDRARADEIEGAARRSRRS